MHCVQFEAGRCRSCTQLDTPYEAQLRRKQAQVQAVLGFVDPCWLPACASREQGFRNKAKMVVSGRRGAPVLGIVDAQGRPVDLCDCPLYSPAMRQALATLRQFVAGLRLSPYDVQGRQGELKFLLLTEGDEGRLLLRWVLRSEAELPKLREALPSLQALLPQLEVISANLQPEHKAVLEGEREILLGGASALRISVNGLPLFLQPKSFFRPTPRWRPPCMRRRGSG
jgi:23S rRNA (uracil747-C5)-methyltransferase